MPKFNPVDSLNPAALAGVMLPSSQPIPFPYPKSDHLKYKLHPALKAAEQVREIASERRTVEKLHRVLKYKLEYYENLFPWLVDFTGEDVDDLIRQITERKKRGQIAKVATARKLLEWIYHILKDGKTFQEVEKVVEAMGKGELVNSSGNA